MLPNYNSLENEKGKAIPEDVAGWVFNARNSIYHIVARLAYRVAGLQFEYIDKDDVDSLFPKEPVPVDMTPIIYGSFVIDTTASDTPSLMSLSIGGAELNGDATLGEAGVENGGTTTGGAELNGDATLGEAGVENGGTTTGGTTNNTTSGNTSTDADDEFEITAEELKAKILAGLADGTITNKTTDENPKVHETTDHSLNRYSTVETTGYVSATFFLLPTSRFPENEYKIASCTPVMYEHETITKNATTSVAMCYIDNEKVTYNGKEYMLASVCNDAEETGNDIDYIIIRK